MLIKNINFIQLKAKLPSVLFYKQPIKSVMQPPQEVYTAISTRGDKNWGILVLHKSTMQHRNDYNGSTLAIDYIESRNKHKGLGKAMIEFAKNYSKQKGCNGYIVLRADSTIDKKQVPHIFYRKQNFTTLDKKIDKKIDLFIRNQQDGTSSDFPTQSMYFPPPQKQNFINKIKLLLKLK